uniref:Uncharacterized protein n=1 Tax=Anguilla anguilla TaxID=7936 RepID=A0A0E9WD10_ANGAN
MMDLGVQTVSRHGQGRNRAEVVHDHGAKEEDWSDPMDSGRGNRLERSTSVIP